MGKDKPVLRIERLTANYNGIYFHANIPVSFDAFHIIEDGLRDEGLNTHTLGGGGSSQSCNFQFGPFKEFEDAKKVIEGLRDKLIAVYENEQKYLSLMKNLEGEYPLYKK